MIEKMYDCQVFFIAKRIIVNLRVGALFKGTRMEKQNKKIPTKTSWLACLAFLLDLVCRISVSCPGHHYET